MSPSTDDGHGKPVKLTAALRRAEPLDTVSESIIEQFTPNGIPTETWLTIRPLVIASIRALGHTGPPTLRYRLSEVAAYSRWLLARDYNLADLSSVWDPTVIENYCTDLERRRTSTSGPARSLLRRVGRICAPHAAYIPQPAARPRKGAAPYTPAEEQALTHGLLHQATRIRGRYGRAAGVLGFGAGLNTPEWTQVTADHIDTIEPGLTVIHVPGEAARTVPIRQPWIQTALGLCDDYPGAPLFGEFRGVSEISRVFNRLSTLRFAPKAPRLQATTMRTTWICNLLRDGMYIQDVLTVAALSSLTTIGDLLPYIPRSTPEVTLRAAAFGMDGVPRTPGSQR